MSQLSAYGRHLFGLLPEVHRERDRLAPPAGRGHLQKYLDSHGVLLDRVRATLEQLYADHFPDVPASGRCQSWVIPYLADLVGAAPVSPFADGQRDEVANAVRWSKRKGSMPVVAEIVETVALSGAEMQEGWKRVVTTARLDDTILPARFFGEPQHPVDAILAGPDPSLPFNAVNPQVAARHPGIRAGTVDLREPSRAVRAQRGEIGARESRFDTALRLWPRDDNVPAAPLPEPTGWRPHAPHGAPCFPGSYEDVSLRTIDTRSPDAAGISGRFHPKSLIIYLPPPYGLCPPDPVKIVWPTAADWADPHHPVHKVLKRSTECDPQAGDLIVIRNVTSRSVLVDQDLTIGPGGDIDVLPGVSLQLEKLRFGRRLALSGGSVRLSRCAVAEFAFGAGAGERRLAARAVLFGSLNGGDGIAELEYCTVLTRVQAAAKIMASEVILPDDVVIDNVACARYSRLPAAALAGDTAGRRRATNTDASPLFVSSTFGAPGAGVLAPAASAALRQGAEDGTEMGTYHDWRYAAMPDVIGRKLADFLPLGIRPVITFDARLSCVPPQLTGS
jgi:hypothetical protein